MLVKIQMGYVELVRCEIIKRNELYMMMKRTKISDDVMMHYTCRNLKIKNIYFIKYSDNYNNNNNIIIIINVILYYK